MENTEFDTLVLEFLATTVLDTFGMDAIVEILIEAYKLGRSDAENGVPDKIAEDSDVYIAEIREKEGPWLEAKDKEFKASTPPD